MSQTQHRQKSPPKRKHTDYKFEDFVNDTGFEHMLSFLDQKSGPNESETLAPIIPAPVTGAPLTGAPFTGAPLIGSTGAASENVITKPDEACIEVPAGKAAFTSAPDIGAPVIDAPEATAVSDYGEAAYIRNPRVPRPWKSVQDAHSHGEQQLYQKMWSLGKGPDTGPKRLIVGTRTLAPMVPLAYSSCVEGLRRLVEKLAIEDCGTRGQKGREYAVFGFDQIIQRRRTAGLTHVLKTARGVMLCSEAGAPVISAPVTCSGAPVTGAPISQTGAPPISQTGAPAIGAHLGITPQGTITSSTKQTLREAIAQHISVQIDDDAVTRIVRNCAANIPDLADDELAELAADRAGYLRYMITNGKQVPSLVGWLITYIPKAVTQEALAKLRDRKRQQAQEWERLSRELDAAQGS